MSTVDPAIARKLREARRPSTALVVLLLALLLTGGSALGFGWGSFGLFESGYEPAVLAIVGISAGMPLTIISTIAWAAVSMKRGDIGWGYGTSAVFLGGGAGVLTAAAPAPGVLIAHIIGYALLALGFLFLVLGIHGTTARRKQEALEQKIIQTGTLTAATVSDKGYVIFSQSTRILTTVTFTFMDHCRVQRWIQKPMLIDAKDPVVDGQESRLWYDPADPGNERRIVVELARTHRFSAPPNQVQAPPRPVP